MTAWATVEVLSVSMLLSLASSSANSRPPTTGWSATRYPTRAPAKAVFANDPK